MMRFGLLECEDLDLLQQREWLETDGCGSYASGTASRVRTRRHHGLLVAEAEPGQGLRLLCAQIEETLFLAGRRFELGANRYSDTIHPQGYHFLVEFRLDPWPVWVYRVEEIVMERSVTMLHECGTAVVGYRLIEAPDPVALEVRPLTSGRDIDGLSFEHAGYRRAGRAEGGRLDLQPTDAGSRFSLTFPTGRFEADGFWYYRFVYSRDAEQGLEHREDMFSPGVVVLTLHTGEQTCVAVSAGHRQVDDPLAAVERERERRAGLVAAAPGTDQPVLSRLVLSADSYLVCNEGRHDVVPGYPWMKPCRRGALVALPGLALATGRGELAHELLRSAAERGPSQCLDDHLWLAWATRCYLAADGDAGFVKEVVGPALVAAIAAYRTGQRSGVKQAPDGLLVLSETGRGLTWMDAVISGAAVEPREGKPVGINALWHHALRLAAELSEGATAAELTGLAEQVRETFRQRFWSAERGWLLNLADGPDGDDETLHPNQILAVSLPGELLPDAVARQVTEVVAARLLTPFGLGAEPAEPGAPRVVWPWLLGPYADALLRFDPGDRKRVARLLEPFEPHLREYGLGHISERFEGADAASLRPAGCFAAAQGLAELLRIAALARG